VTDVHPFYVRKFFKPMSYAWIEAKNLRVWDVLLMSNGKLVWIEKIDHYPNIETVYNLEVSGNHDYFVDEWYLVHNKWGWGWWSMSWSTWGGWWCSYYWQDAGGWHCM
jgi:hypothetical protein